jgi:hypothetical protein
VAYSLPAPVHSVLTLPVWVSDAGSAHYNDAGIIERRATPDSALTANDEYWSTRAVFAHGIKVPSDFSLLKERWNLSRPDAAFDTLECWPSDQLPSGANVHYGNWGWARVPCPKMEYLPEFTSIDLVDLTRFRTLSPAEQKAEIERVDGLIARVRGPVHTGRFCDVKPQENFKFCSFPWVVPEIMKRRQGAKRAARLSAKIWEEWKAANPEKKNRRKRAKTKKLRRSVEEGAS